MERAELRDRARQEIGKRQDGLLALFQFDFALRVRRSDHSKAGNFFFAAEDVDARLDLLRQRLPAQVATIIRQSDMVLQHRFDLLGYADLNYGSPIDWHLDLVNGKRAPRKVFYRVHYLDFGEVGDSKVTWELNRHQHLVTLAKAYRLTGNARYPDEILRQWRQWWAENPYAIGINWASSLEVAFRSLSWLWTYHLLEGAPGLPDFREEWLRGMALHGRHIQRYLSTYFSPNTHLLGEGVALFFLGVLCPELADAENWKAKGWQIVLEEARRQVQGDGFHFEQSTYYHVYALDFFIHAAILASLNNVSLPTEFEKTIEEMSTALCLLGRAGGPPRFGDDDGGRLFDPRRNCPEHLLDPLSTGAVLFNRGDFKRAAVSLREETIWLLGTQGVKVWDELETNPLEMSSAALTKSGYYLLSSEKPNAQLVADCGPLGTQSGGHGHADALSVTLQSKGHSLLIDPGTYQYAGEGNERDLFRGTAMHNTVRVDGLDQAEPATPFSWRRMNSAKVEHWIQGRSFDFLVASHNGYERLAQPATHRRWILSLRNGMYLVRDRVEGNGKHLLELSWHLGQDLQMIEHGLYRVKQASHGLALLPAEGHGWAEEVRKQFWSPAYGEKAGATVAVFSTNGELPREFCVLLVTLEEALRIPGTFAKLDGKKEEVAVDAYRFLGDTGEHRFYFSNAGTNWQHSEVSSDARFVCWIHAAGAAEKLILAGGSYAVLEGGPELRLKRSVAWGELTVAGESRQVSSSEPDALCDDAELSLQISSNSPLG